MFYEQERYAILGAAYEVIKQLGTGFTELVYQDALEVEFALRGIPYEREKELLPDYKGHTLRHTFVPDFICYDKIIVECKAVSQLIGAHEAQTLNYMQLAQIGLGILMNFGQFPLEKKVLIKNEFLN